MTRPSPALLQDLGTSDFRHQGDRCSGPLRCTLHHEGCIKFTSRGTRQVIIETKTPKFDQLANWPVGVTNVRVSGCPYVASVEARGQWQWSVGRSVRGAMTAASLQRDAQPAGDMPSHEVTKTVLHLSLLNILLRIYFLQLSNQHFSGVLLPLSSWCLVY